ncbi:MAG TPA: ribosome biogenesis factor YjgA [Caldimonas sp.]|nr:ribosome biogenesis factor YjgA [Caldimonas sp.]HEX4236269.1 ribosome biogenesis factor YjgA [Caldimonas sp.]
MLPSTELPAADVRPGADDGVDIGAAGRPSKTRRKVASHDLQSLGEALLELADDHLAALALDEALLDALRAARRIRSHEARRRQMQLIGKLMRSADVEHARVAIDERRLGHARDSLALHQAERWRVELIADDEATTRFAREHANADLQQLRALVRNARKDGATAPEQRSGRAYRELFRFIREHERDG